MPLYEHVFLARQDVSAQQVETMLKDFQAILEQNGGSASKSEYWGVKTLSYKIKKNRKAHYALMNIDAPHAAVAEMERQMRIASDILRFITIRVDEHETEPSAMMRKSDRDDRRGGRRFGPRRDHDRGPRRDRDDGPRRDRADGPRRDRDGAPKAENTPAADASRSEGKEAS